MHKCSFVRVEKEVKGIEHGKDIEENAPIFE